MTPVAIGGARKGLSCCKNSIIHDACDDENCLWLRESVIVRESTCRNCLQTSPDGVECARTASLSRVGCALFGERDGGFAFGVSTPASPSNGESLPPTDGYAWVPNAPSAHVSRKALLHPRTKEFLLTSHPNAISLVHRRDAFVVGALGARARVEGRRWASLATTPFAVVGSI